MDGLIVDHSVVIKFDQITVTNLPKASAVRLMFRHASVGGTIDNGLTCLQGTRSSPSQCTQYPAYKYDRRNWSFQPRGNSGWYGKVDDFVTEVQKQIDSFDIFSFKYCYLEGLDGLLEPCGSPFSEARVKQAWEYLRDKMEMLESRYPKKIFIWWTIPLTQVGQYCTDTLNALIRVYARDKKKILFDIADIEAYDSNGKQCVNNQGWEIACKEYCGEQNPGAQACHPNWTGAILLAKAFWWMMSEIAAGNVVSNVNDVTERNFTFDTYPNPIRSSASIKFSISRDEFVSLKVFDLFGKEMETLVNDFRQAGDYVYDFNNYNSNDRLIAKNGLYIVRLQIGNISVVKKLLVIK